jgi:hypothetical protein
MTTGWLYLKRKEPGGLTGGRVLVKFQACFLNSIQV